METDPWVLIKKYNNQLVIVAVGFLVFFNMLFNGFVWDDLQYVVNNPQVHTINILLLLGKNFFNGGFFYRPVSAVYFATVYTLFNGQSFPFHMFQLAVHIVNTLFLFKLFRYFLKKNIAFCLALLFLVHPMVVESVSYISTIDDTLFLFLGLVGLLLLLGKDTSLKKNVIAASCFFLMLVTKETGIIFLFLSGLLVFLFKRRDFLSAVVISVISLVLYIVVRFAAGFSFSSPAPVPIAQLPLSERIFSMPLIFLYYLKTFFYPINLTIDQQWVVHIPSWQNFYVPLLFSFAYIGRLVVGFYVIPKRENKYMKAYLFFACWFFLGLSLHMQIMPLEMTVADRWFYAPMVGLLGMLGIFYEVFLMSRQKKIQKISLILFVIILLVLSLRTMFRNTNWTDALTLYSHDATLTKSYDLENNLATEFMKTGDSNAAFYHEQQSVAFFPGQINQSNLAVLYERKGDLPMAKKYFENSFSPRVDRMYGFRHDPQSLVYYAEFLSLYGENATKSAMFINHALTEYPKLSELWTYLAISEYKQHNFSEANKAINTAFSFSPNPQVFYVMNQIHNKLPIEVVISQSGGKVKIY